MDWLEKIWGKEKKRKSTERKEEKKKKGKTMEEKKGNESKDRVRSQSKGTKIKRKSKGNNEISLKSQRGKEQTYLLTIAIISRAK